MCIVADKGFKQVSCCLRHVHIMTIADDIFVSTFFHLGYKKTDPKPNKTYCNTKYLSVDGRNILICIDLNVDCNQNRIFIIQYGPRREKICLRGFANSTGADQPAHPRSLISAFVICFLKSTVCKLPTMKFQFSS